MASGKWLLYLLITLLSFTTFAQPATKVSVSGTIKDQKTGETLTGATVSFAGHPDLGVATNAYGFYSITVPAGHYLIYISFAGYATDSISLDLRRNTVVNRLMAPANSQLQQVVVTGRKGNNILVTPPGVQHLNMDDIKDIPVLLGEKDVMKTIQLLPGIASAGDGKSGFFVRGGGADQNLILLDEATVYNASHLLGFFSVFNSDAIKYVTLYKSGMPANFGGRLASVEDIKMKDGNDREPGVSGGIGLIDSRLTVEGPIGKGKGSFIVSARRTYLDLFTQLASDSNIKGTKLYFYDVNLKGNYTLNQNNRVFLSGYFGKDDLQIKQYSNDDGINWGNATATFRWNHVFNSKLFSNTSLIYSRYNYNALFLSNINNINVTSAITDYHFKEDLNYYVSPRSKLDFGVDITSHVTQPGQAQASASSKFNSVVLQKKYALESAAYLSHEWSPSAKWKFTYGARLTMLSVLGPDSVYTYDAAGDRKTATWYGNGKFVKTYVNPEPRIAVSYQLDEISSVKVSYDRNVQNIHLLNNSTSTSPTNVYLPTSNIVKPEIADQVAAGYYRTFHERQYEFSSEVYYKWMWNQIDYRDGAQLLGNNNVESQLLFGKGRAYGWENYIKKKTGRLTGWISYTLSRTERQIAGINNGNWYLASQDQTNSISVVGIYKFSRKWTFSGTWVYNTGNPVTWPSGKFPVDGVPVYYYTSRNGYRLPAYHRLDLGATVITKKTARFESSLTFSLYNAYGRSNPYTILFQRDPNNPLQTQVQQTTLFKWIPSITYNFKF